jgi:hypothetical protein
LRGHSHVSIRSITGLAVAGAVLVAALPASAQAEPSEVAELPRCADEPNAPPGLERAADAWRVNLDEEGVVSGHHLIVRRDGRDVAVRSSRRGFAMDTGGGHLLIGERGDDHTRLHRVDTRRGCRDWSRTLDEVVFPASGAVVGGKVQLSAHDPTTRAYRGTFAVEAETGDTEGLTDADCVEACVPHDGAISPAAFEPSGSARPTPAFAAGGWPSDKTLRFRWRSGAVPPSWARPALEKAADDAGSTSVARSPEFVYRSAATDAVAYGGSMPGFCSITGIACAGRVLPVSWGVWLRPYGTEYAWGTLRWCQKTSSSQGCFDIRRVMLHELGHITGLTHPSSAGFTLAAQDTVMHAITPSRPHAGASRHAFGRCDVATLQELYDTPDNKTAVSTCNQVTTSLTLEASDVAIAAGESVELTARLRVEHASAYGELAGNPLNGRSVKLKYRRAGSDDSWRTAWMRSTYRSGRYVLTIRPTDTWDFKAVFPSPDDEGLRYSRSGIVRVQVQG